VKQGTKRKLNGIGNPEGDKKRMAGRRLECSLVSERDGYGGGPNETSVSC